MDNVEINKNTNDVNMSTPNSFDELKLNKKKLQEELNKFLRSHTVYETIPENMKVLFNLIILYIVLLLNQFLYIISYQVYKYKSTKFMVSNVSNQSEKIS